MTEQKTPDPPQFGKLLAAYSPKVELVLSALALAAWLLGADPQVMMITLTVLAGFYFLSAFIIVQLDEIYGHVAVKVSGISSAVCVFALLFKILSLEGYRQMMMVGLLSVVAALVIMVGFFLKSQNKNYLRFIIRSLALTGISLYVFSPELKELTF
ncbi:MAG: hypothetical protein ACK4RF_02610 [Cyclobacteriaceae bacterium]